MKTKSWHWPDHIIRKRESRRLRDEHNALVNQGARLYDTLKGLQWKINAYGTHWQPSQAEREAIFTTLTDWEQL